MKLKRTELIVIGMVLIFSFIFFAGQSRAWAQAGEPVRAVSLSASGYERANTLAFSSDGKYMAVGGISGIYVFDSQTLSAVNIIQAKTWSRSISFLPNTGILAAGLFDNTIKFWNVSDTSQLKTLDGPKGWVRGISVSGDGALIASASDDDTLRVWEVNSGKSILVINKNTSGIRAVALSPDGKMAAGALGDNTIRIWSVPDGTLVNTLEGHDDWVRCLTFSPDGKLLASGGFDKTVRLWSIPDGKEVRTMEGHESSVLSIAFSTDGSTLASGSVDETVRLWQVETGEALQVLRGHTDFVYAVAFSPDGKTLASGGGDNAVRVWDLQKLDNIPSQTSEAQITPSDCRSCHHRRGNVQPARVIELGCEGCHAGGISLSWCDGISRAGGIESTNAVYQAVPEVSGVPVNGREIGVVIMSPGNGETWYVSGGYMAPEKISGKVYYAVGESLTKITVQLDIISGGQIVDSLFTNPTESGDFSINAEIDTDAPPIFYPVPPNNALCASCHVRTGDRVGLPKGNTRIRITATAPNGDQASDERWLRIDSSQQATIPVQVIDDVTGNPIPNLVVRASTILYYWRSRTADAISDMNGNVQLKLEVLSQSSTVFVVNVPSQVANGLLYTGGEPVHVKLEPGEVSHPAIIVTAHAQAGNLRGKLTGTNMYAGLEGANVWAVKFPAGPVYQTLLSADGTFIFDQLPIDRYLIFVDPYALAQNGLHVASQNVNLAESPQMDISMDLSESRQISGKITLQDGSTLPFAWVSVGQDPQSTPSNPFSSEYLVFDVPSGVTFLTVSAPGYYSLSQHIDSAQEISDFQLVPKPETRRIPWGDGGVILPPETNATVDGLDIKLDYGWLWGKGNASEPLRVRVPGLNVNILKGEFALEKAATGTAWLYLYSGAAEVVYDSGQASNELRGGEMIALMDEAKPIPMDASLAEGLQPVLNETPIAEVIQPSLKSQLKDRIVKTGITLAQITTFIAYVLSFAVLIGIPAFALLRAKRK